MQWILYFLLNVQSAHPVQSTKVQASPMTTNTILMSYQLTGGLYTGPWDMPTGCDDNNYYCCNTNPLEGKWYCGICVRLALRIMYVTAINLATMKFPLLLLLTFRLYLQVILIDLLIDGDLWIECCLLYSWN